MTELLLAVRALASEPCRPVYLVMTLALAIAAWLILGVLMAPFFPSAASGDRQARVVVAIEAASEGHDLPLRYARRLAVMEGVQHVVYSTIILVTCKDTASAISIQAFGGSREGILASPMWPPSSPELHDMQSRWFDDPMGVLLGPKTAADCQWQTGMGVSPANVFTRRPVAMNIAGIRPQDENPIANSIVFGHYEYFNRAALQEDGKDTVSDLAIYPEDPGRVHTLVAQIEDAFAHDDPPIIASADAVVQNALARFGVAQYVLGAVMLAVLLCTLLVMISVLAHAIAQRRASLALLLVLGFRHGTLWRAFVLEFLAITILAALVGIGVAMLLLNNLPDSMGLFFNGFRIPAWVWQGLPVILLFVAAVSLIAPITSISRLRTTDLLAP